MCWWLLLFSTEPRNCKHNQGRKESDGGAHLLLQLLHDVKLVADALLMMGPDTIPLGLLLSECKVHDLPSACPAREAVSHYLRFTKLLSVKQYVPLEVLPPAGLQGHRMFDLETIQTADDCTVMMNQTRWCLQSSTAILHINFTLHHIVISR